jgi:MoaA/NifB/PqqE/SkfB family radical SAM enzyme
MKSLIKNLKSLKSLRHGRLPGQLVIQYTNQCNANCPQCGMRRSMTLSRSTLPKDYVKKLIDDAAQKGVTFVSFTGGEPLMYLNDIIELIKHTTRAGIPYVRTGTNGFLFRDSESPHFHDKISRIAEMLSTTDLYTFWISIDSVIPGDHEQMRGLQGVVKGIEKAIPIFHDHGIYPSANLGINRATGGMGKQPFLSKMTEKDFQTAFETSFENFYQFVYELGFTIVNACYPMSSDNCTGDQSADTSLYGASSSDAIINFTKEEKALIFKALFETIPKFRGKLRIFSPRCSLHGLTQKYTKQQAPLFPCRGGTDFFFVECGKGLIHPCGYLENPRRSIPDLNQRLNQNLDCDKCEWECFRDPSDILGPFADFFSQPFTLFGKLLRDPRFFQLLKQDLSYYRACEFFNGRLAPQLEAMRSFEAK